MKYLLYSILATAIAGGVVMGTQESNPPNQPGQQSDTEDAKQTPGVEQAEKPSLQDEDSQTEAQQEEELEPFTPSEEVPVDSAISFPVDI